MRAVYKRISSIKYYTLRSINKTHRTPHNRIIRIHTYMITSVIQALIMIMCTRLSRLFSE